MNTASPTHCGYGPGHPWYYLLGGPLLSPKQIRDAAQHSGYGGYRHDEIAAADRKPEPVRSAALRNLRDDVKAELARDLTGYRTAARKLTAYRMETAEQEPDRCHAVHTAMSLKHNHLFNEFAHLAGIEAHLDRQRDLFGE